MKNVMYLLIVGTMFIFTACNCGAGDTAATEETATEEVIVEEAVEEVVVACADDCKKACCLGCKATVGEKSCDLLASGDHSCCAPAEEATEETHDHGPEGHSH